MVSRKVILQGLLSGLIAFVAAGFACAESYNVKVFDKVVLKRAGSKCADDRNCINRLHPKIPFAARAKPGQLIVFETRDPVDSDFTMDTQFPRDLNLLSRDPVHPLTGPVYIEGATRGDALAVTIVDIEPGEFGVTLILGSGLAAKDFPGPPKIFKWKLTREEAVSDQIPGVRIPYQAFPGTIAVLPGEKEVIEWRDRELALLKEGGDAVPPTPKAAVPAAVCGPEGSHRNECLRTIPPRENGGNLDAKYLGPGVTILLPCFVDGCGLAIGDVHFAQGDGEVVGTAIEMPSTVTVRTEIRKGQGAAMRMPRLVGRVSPRSVAPGPFYATFGIPVKPEGTAPRHLEYLHSDRVARLKNLNGDIVLAAYNALSEMIDYLVHDKGMTRDQAYVIASIAVDIRITHFVDWPNLTAMAILPLGIFEK